jgi:hypothetical protein
MNTDIQTLPLFLPTGVDLHPLIHPVFNSTTQANGIVNSTAFYVDTEGDGAYCTHAALLEPLQRILISWFKGIEFTISSEKTLRALMDAGDLVKTRVDVVIDLTLTFSRFHPTQVRSMKYRLPLLSSEQLISSASAAYEIQWSQQYHKTHEASPTNRRFGEFVDVVEWDMTARIQRLSQSLPTVVDSHPLINPFLASSFPIDTEADGILYTHAALLEPLHRILIQWFKRVEFRISSEKTLYALMGEGDRVEGRVDVVLTARMAGSTACPHTVLLYEAKRPGTL